MKIRKSASSHGTMTTASGTATPSSSLGIADSATLEGATGGLDHASSNEKPATSASKPRRGSSGVGGATSSMLSGFGILKKKSITGMHIFCTRLFLVDIYSPRLICLNSLIYHLLLLAAPPNLTAAAGLLEEDEPGKDVKRGSFTQHQNDIASDMVPTSKALHISLEDNPNMIVYQKMEKILKAMQKEDGGVPIRNVKSVWNKIPSVFTGQDLVSWLLSHLDITDQVEALILANRMSASGYYFPIDDHVLGTIQYNHVMHAQWPLR